MVMLLRTARLSKNFTQTSFVMAAPRQSYASMVGPGKPSSQPAQPTQPSTSNGSSTMDQSKPKPQQQQQQQQGHQRNHHGGSASKAVPNESYIPKTTSSEESVYVLTILTNAKHHETMTKMRNKYFPKRLNRLEAHLTLFHALPGSRLDDSIKPTLTEVANSTAPFDVLAAKPFRLTKGIAIGLPKTRGGDDAREVHGRLKKAWSEFLSRQDAGGFAAHYTIMNKMDEERAVQEAFEEVEGSWKGCRGTAEGLSLFLYDKGNWVHVEDFRFTG